MKKFNTAQRLRQIMSERNLKQIDIVKLAEPFCIRYKTKLGRNDISQYISGKSKPGQNKLYILACALDVNEAWLMGYDITPERTDTKESFELNSHEQKVITLYRSKPEMQPAVDKLLGVDEEPAESVAYAAAQSGKKIKTGKPSLDDLIEINNKE